MRRTKLLALLGSTLLATSLLARTATASSLSSARLNLHRARVEIWHGQTTIRFFEHHQRLVHAARTHLAAERALRRAHHQLREGRAALARVQNRIWVLTNPAGFVEHVIMVVFGAYGQQALGVARCETGGTFSLGSANGQYLGLFQMGSWERWTYADGRYTTAWDQARAAYRYFVAGGRDWHQWQCKPDGTLRW